MPNKEFNRRLDRFMPKVMGELRTIIEEHQGFDMTGTSLEDELYDHMREQFEDWITKYGKI